MVIVQCTLYYGRSVQKAASSSIFDQIKFIDPVNPNKQTQKSVHTGSIFDYYTPIDTPKPDINKDCYWDKRSLKIKRDIEKAVEKSANERRFEQSVQNREYAQRQEAESANRRSNLQGTLYQL